MASRMASSSGPPPASRYARPAMQHARRADPALGAAGDEERGLQRVERGGLAAGPGAGAARPSTVRIVAPSTWQTGTRQLSTGAPSSEHRAGAALALPAALLGPGQGEVLAQDVEQPAHARDVDGGLGRR